MRDEVPSIERDPALLEVAMNLPFRSKALNRAIHGLQRGDDEAFHWRLLRICIESGRSYSAIMLRHEGNPVQVEYRHLLDDRWAYIQSCDDGFSVRYLNRLGHYGNDAASSIEHAVDIMVRGGFACPSFGALECLQATAGWQQNARLQELVKQWNRRQITMEQCVSEYQGMAHLSESEAVTLRECDRVRIGARAGTVVGVRMESGCRVLQVVPGAPDAAFSCANEAAILEVESYAPVVGKLPLVRIEDCVHEF